MEATITPSRAAHIAQAEARKAQVRPVIDQIRRAGVTTLVGIAEALNARGVKTARGGTWSATQVSPVMLG